MAIQDKIEISLDICQKHLSIPISFSIADQVLFSFNEHETLKISQVGSKYKVQIECFSYIIDGIITQTKQGFMTLTEKEATLYCLSNRELGYNPGYYLIKFKKDKEEFIAYFLVKTNSQVSLKALDKIKVELEEFKKGLSYDRFKPGKETIVLKDYKNCIELIDNWDILRKTIVNTTNTFSLKTSLMYQSKVGTSNFKSLSKEIIQPKDKFLNIVKKLIDKPKNISIYRPLIIKKMEEFITNYKEELRETKVYYANISKTILETELANTNQLNILASNQLKSLNNEKNILETEIKLKETRLNKAVIINQELNSIYNDEFLINIYTKLQKNTTVLVSNKASSKIFELYGFIIIKKVLEDLGYTFVNKAEFEKGEFRGTNISLLFCKGSSLVKVIYDSFIDHYTKANIDSLACVNAFHNKPDYTILFYQNAKFKTALILEMKYRNSNYIFTNSYDQIVENTDNYALLVYKDKEYQIWRNVVEEVLLINPSIDEITIKKGIATTFIGYNLNKKLEDNLTFSYLKNKCQKLSK